MRRTGPTPDVRDDVILRDEGRCIRCGADLFDQPASLHHRKPRRMGGTRRPEINARANLVLLCGTGTTGCHGFLETHRIQAGIEGFVLSDCDDPEQVAVHTWRGRAYLSNDGMLALLPGAS